MELYRNPKTIIEKARIKNNIMELVSQEVEQWLEAEGKIQDGYDYESKFMDVAQRVNKILLSQSRGTVPQSRNKKNFKPVLERLK